MLTRAQSYVVRLTENDVCSILYYVGTIIVLVYRIAFKKQNKQQNKIAD